MNTKSMMLVWALLAAAVRTLAQEFDETKFSALIDKVEADTRELARKVEEAYLTRCDTRRLSECGGTNYDHCLSSFPTVTCPGEPAFRTPACGIGDSCSAVYSYDVSTVALPKDVIVGPNGNPTDPQVIETVCYSQDLDEYFIEKTAQDATFWEDFGGQPSAVYFGSATGAFRMFPARVFEECGGYDPRIRPWYVAAGSGPKNIVMVLDKSGSMSSDNRIELLKDAAKRIVETANVGDRIAIVTFESSVTSITDNGYMVVANDDNKRKMTKAIDEIEASGGTNFRDAFIEAFDILDRSAAEEFTVSCNTAILFLTDGEMTEPTGVSETDVIDLINQRYASSTDNLRGNPIYVFTFSVSGGGEVDDFPSKLACSIPSRGIWSRIDYAEDIVSSLSSYNKLFALGLGSDRNQDFVAWVEPYKWIPGDTMGTTISAPVYDRSKEPHLFLGVVGIDLALAALDAALGVDGSVSDESFQRVVRRSTARCPRVELSQCELESYRRQSAAGDAALCGRNCSATDFVQVEEQKCPTISDYPQNLWDNVDQLGASYQDHGCCIVGETKSSTECYDSSLPAKSKDGGASTVAIVVGIGAGLATFVLLGVGLKRSMSSQDSDSTTDLKPVAPPAPDAVNPYYRPAKPAY